MMEGFEETGNLVRHGKCVSFGIYELEAGFTLETTTLVLLQCGIHKEMQNKLKNHMKNFIASTKQSRV
jgi:translation initiation factor 2 beta subunit (eIF-2beta)/eIF-5